MYIDISRKINREYTYIKLKVISEYFTIFCHKFILAFIYYLESAVFKQETRPKNKYKYCCHNVEDPTNLREDFHHEFSSIHSNLELYQIIFWAGSVKWFIHELLRITHFFEGVLSSLFLFKLRLIEKYYNIIYYR